MARKYGLGDFVEDTIKANKDGKCKGTEHECEMLARMVNDERLHRKDIPKVLGKTYNKAFDNNDFERIKKFKRQGIYSKVSALLLKAELEANGNTKNKQE